jgi:hypothetical protein
MRPTRPALLLLLPLALGGCDPTAVGIAAVATGGTVAVMGRTPFDGLVSIVTGKDCSAVRLDRGRTYCASEQPPPTPPPYCTRSIGSVDCWVAPPFTIPPRPGLADGPTTLTPEQEANRRNNWLNLF